MEIKNNLKSKHIISNRYTSTRTLPKNYSEKDNNIFKNELSRTINKTYYLNKKKITLFNSYLFFYKFIPLKSKFYRMQGSYLSMIKNSIKNIINYSQKEIQTEYIDSASWVVDDKSHNYFHWMTDVLGRVFILDNKIQQYPILLPSELRNSKFILETLEILEIPYKLFEREKKYLIKNLVLPSRTAEVGNYNKNFIHDISNQLVKSRLGNPRNENIKKIWLSRENESRRRIKNETEVKDFLLSKGYKCVYPDKLKLSEQIDLFKNVERVVSIHGAALTNIMFMNKNSKVLEIRNNRDLKNNSFFSLASEFEIEYFYFLAESLSNNVHDDLTVDIKEFSKTLKLFENPLEIK